MSALGRFPIKLEVPVAWGDMDAFGHVNNTVYLRWFESGRIAYFDAIKLDDKMRSEGIGPILARTSCDFKIPLAYPDTVRIAATVTKLGNSSFSMGYRVESEKHDWALAAEGDAIVVMLDYAAHKKVRLPEDVREYIEALES